MGRLRFDLLAAAASVLALVMLVVYVSVIREQGGEVAPWAVVVLVAGAAGAAYGSVRASPHRWAVLVAAGVLLVALGVLALLTIGLPILLAGLLCLVSAGRAGVTPATPAAAGTKER